MIFGGHTRSLVTLMGNRKFLVNSEILANLIFPRKIRISVFFRGKWSCFRGKNHSSHRSADRNRRSGFANGVRMKSKTRLAVTGGPALCFFEKL